MSSREHKKLLALIRAEKKLDAAIAAMKMLLKADPIPAGTPMREDDSRVVLIERMTEQSLFIRRKATWLSHEILEAEKNEQ